MTNIPSIVEETIPSKRCVAYCTATAFQLKPLFDALKLHHKTTMFKDLVHIEVQSNQSEAQVRDIFCFSYGVAVFWGFEEAEEKEFLNLYKPIEYRADEKKEREVMNFSFGTSPKIEEEEIILPDTDLFSRLAVSHGLAQSVKLATFENAIQKTINTTKTIPEQLATRGKIPLSKREIRKKMGELFIERSSINLHSDILDIPEFFWDHSEVEPLYTMIAMHLDLETRLEVLNQRLDIVHDLFEMLGNELNHQHSSKLEWIIIWLIVIEVVITLVHQYG
ncbi:MAG: hypothetical protein JWO53_524 [Chlamydiia bacterium]|nr:hypothetical protein [Chlamydiia bacterium]